MNDQAKPWTATQSVIAALVVLGGIAFVAVRFLDSICEVTR